MTGLAGERGGEDRGPDIAFSGEETAGSGPGTPHFLFH
jgi:hypothetical protein